MTTLPALLQNAVRRFPGRPAVLEPAREGMTTLTYSQLLERIHNFAGYLQQQNIQKGDRIFIWSISRIDWLVAYFGSLFVGLVVVPLDVSTKEDFLHRLTTSTEAKYLITTKKQYQTISEPPVPWIDIDDLPTAPLDHAALPPLSPNDLAELVFTSGTTGHPKGVMLTHENISANAQSALAVIPIRENDRSLSILPLSHMLELTVEIAILTAGASVVYSHSLSPETLLRLLASQHVTLMVLVPQALQLFMNGIEREVRRQKKEKAWKLLLSVAKYLPFSWRKPLFGSVHQRFGGHFRFFVSGGAYLQPELGFRWEEMGIRIIQGYGATECSPTISLNPYHDHTLTSVGQPLPGVEVRITEDHEILVRGKNVSQGYWQEPEMTAATFKEGWYHTGDLGSRDAHGNLYIKGRKKNIIVLANGLNVYPEDVENILMSTKAFKDVVVIGLEDANKGPEVHAIFLMETADRELARSTIQEINKQLAAHQQVKGFTIWPELDFPRTPSLKVKRQEVMVQLPEFRATLRA